MKRLAIAAAVAATAVVVSAAPAAADPMTPAAAHARFDKAARLMADGRFADAAALFLEVAESGDPSLSDDAMIKVAQLYEERLARPADALAMYERLVAAFPQSRLARRAARRIDVLREGLGDEGEHAASLAAYNDVLYGYAHREPMESIARMKRVLAEHQTFPKAADARYWIATTYAREGRYDEAIRWYREVLERHPDTDLAWRARKERGDALLARGDFDAAESAYRSLIGEVSPAVDRIAEDALGRVERDRARARRARWAWVVVILFGVAMIASARQVTGSWRDAGRALARPPVEVAYFAPIAVVLVVGSVTANLLVARAVPFLLVGGLGVAWLSGAVLDAASRHGRASVIRTVAHAVAATVCVLALAYLAVAGDHLLDFLRETWLHGHE